MSPRKPTDEELDNELDAELENTFPASDPPSLTEPVGDARPREAGLTPQPPARRVRRARPRRRPKD